ncbi:Pimeloyl-ACP methyl ester carboxylesterase [Spirosoma endophyticum]|uniref:Pimeloyl-ACP methyl ester carboxylesterase n=2 Tax=Spirosoma endophyticum TaxID=662367 RepID=A0A1I1MXC7_9BACT|nr:Pimeloyl-ACP methyl ester carboxylesterase [Spirosoma endophyticum]
MQTMNHAVLGALLSIIMILSTTKDVTAQASTTGVKNIVLVHGTWADGSSWAKVIPLLEAKGLNVMAVQNPLTSLADDVAATKRAIELMSGPVLLVGHSWGGVVITEAGNHDKVAGLVYVAAAAPDEGQSFLELVQTAASTPGNDEIRPDAYGFVSMSPKGINEDFAQDLPESERKLLVATQGPQAFTALKEKITKAAWKSKPSWYVVAANDRMINPDLERTLAKKLKATTIELKSSHVAMLAQSEKVATFILEAASKMKSK